MEAEIKKNDTVVCRGGYAESNKQYQSVPASKL